MWWECNEDYAMGGVAMDGIVNRFPAFFPDQDLARLARHWGTPLSSAGDRIPGFEANG